jgi:hypothetical protein
MFTLRRTMWIVVLAALGLSFACGLLGQVDEANKLVDEANAIIKGYNEDSAKSGKLLTELLGENLKGTEDIEEYKTENKAKFDELVSLNTKLEKSGADATAKFDQASKLKLDDKFKEYLGLKVQEMTKRVEVDKMTSAFVKSFLEAKDVAKVNTVIGDYNKKSADTQKQADELMAKADKIVKDNPGVFKGN